MTEAFTRWLSLRAYGAATSTLFRSRTPPQIMRRRFERYGATSRARLLARHPGLSFAEHPIGKLRMESVRAVAAPERERVMLYLHGGAYVMGSIASYRSRTARMSFRCEAEVFVPDYRLAPEHPFPAALDDALIAWQYLKALRRGVPAFLAGDSAGGGLALSLMLRLRELGEALPDGAVLLSPWTNLTGQDDSARHNDLWLSPAHLSHWAGHYVGGSDPADPLVSPALADLSCLPPMLVLVGEDELLAESTRRWVARAQTAGSRATLLVGTGMQHDWPLTLPWLAESRHAWREIAEFVRHTATQS